ncbi:MULTISPECIES: DUF3493 domain-containing protein [Aphanothece]|uniref:DUF3493 domain-containing protein n=1 Tax=Aphanothece TaxID=1121 RepID=UPI003984ADE4
MGIKPDAIDPRLRARLLQESRTPWRGLRRALWLALAASGGLGLAVMAMRGAAGSEVPSGDLLIQLAAVVLFGGLLWFDRNRAPADGTD